MARCGRTMAEALREAQRLGLAEKAPSLDLSGGDTAHKLSVIASLLAGRRFPAERIPQEKNGKYRFTICRLPANV